MRTDDKREKMLSLVADWKASRLGLVLSLLYNIKIKIAGKAGYFLTYGYLVQTLFLKGNMEPD